MPGQFKIHTRADGTRYWELESAEGAVVARSEGSFTTSAEARKDIGSMRLMLAGAGIEDA